MENGGGFITNVIIVAAILGIVFLSQQAQFRPIGRSFYQKGRALGVVYISQASDWANKNIAPKVDGEVSTIKLSAGAKITQQKNNLLQTIWQNIENYLAAKFSNTFGTKVK